MVLHGVACRQVLYRIWAQELCGLSTAGNPNRLGGRNQALRITAKFLRQTELFHEIPGSFAIAFGMPASLYGAKPHLYAVSAIFIIFATISFIHGFFGATVQLRPFFKILLSAQKRNRFPGNNRGIASVVVDYEIICPAEIENRKCTCWGAFSRIDNFFGKVKGGRRRCCKKYSERKQPA